VSQLLPALDRFLARADALRESRRAKPEQRAFLAQEDANAEELAVALAADVEALFADLAQRTDVALGLQPVVLAEAVDPRDRAYVLALLAAMALGDWRVAFLAPLFRQHYARVAERTFETMSAAYQLEAFVGLPDPVARRVVATGGTRAGLVDIEPQTQRALFDALAQARADGLGPAEAARLIRQYVPAGRFTAMERAEAGSGVRYRAQMIARTETLHAQRISTLDAGNAAGFRLYRAFDNRTGFDDEECMARDQVLYTLDDARAETAREHPNGTLSWAMEPGSNA